ncbi:hypothetical protein LTR56_012106 [Elasticomyces elasticus]|nr:hypothetical protein LTR56_012106 [Elasticomyces elasticus]KAK3665718.1 hypothetical protein LTR22_003349 [Elasticomyces elasticus]KAK4896671.1 hypothetical protein LTR49_028113 [Elasticomyces elasticus]KAK5757264.1 hypothetical protein LTS12_012622 [Elasticomyces elasticus]
MEAAGVTLGSISVFFDIFDACDRLYQGCKVTKAFGKDFENAIAELEMQWARFCICVTKRQLSPGHIDQNSLHTGNALLIQKYLKTMLSYFESAHEINERYTKSGVPESDQTVPIQETSEASAETHVAGKIRNFLRVPRLLKRKESHGDGRNFRSRLSRSGSPASGSSSPSPARSANVSVGHDQPHAEGPEYEVAPAFQAQDLHGARQLKRILWAEHDQDRFMAHIASLREGNTNLERLLDSLEPCKHVRVLPTYGDPAALDLVVDKVRRRLGALHEDLKDINPNPDFKAAETDGKSFHLSVQLLENHELARQGLAELPKVRKRLRRSTHTTVYRVQRHDSIDPETASQLLMFDVGGYAGLPEPGHSAETGGSPMKSLSRPEEKVVDLGDDFELWGRILTERDHPTAYHVYCSKQTQWFRVSTLETLFNQPEYREKLMPEQIAQLARLLLYSYLYLDNLHASGSVARPRDIYFYQPKEQQDVGSGEPLNYGQTRQDLIAAKHKALLSLNHLDRRVSSTFAQIVSAFLNFESEPLHLRKGKDDGKQQEYIKNAVSALHKLSRDLEATVLPPVKVLSVRPASTIGSPIDEENLTSNEARKNARVLEGAELTPSVSSGSSLDKIESAGNVSQQGREQDEPQANAGAESGEDLTARPISLPRIRVEQAVA